MNIILLCDKPKSVAATLHHHINALSTLSVHNVSVMPMLGSFPHSVDLNRFDSVVVHWSLVACDDSYLSPETRIRLGAFKGLKALFIQDEYRFVNKSIAAFRELGIHVLFTCVPQDEIEKVYPSEKLPGVVKFNTLTGYVDKSLFERQTPLLIDRPIDVSYRARELPAWLGSFGQEKHLIGERFRADSNKWKLVCDISSREEDRLYGDKWIDFLIRSKAVLGVESGASVVDFNGKIQTACESDLRANPMLTFEELRDRHFKDQDGLIRFNQISPRCFEASALKTLMILYEGEYSGRLIPWRHYIPLSKNHSNMEDVVSTLRDPDLSQAIVDSAYEEVARNPMNSFENFVAAFDDVMEQQFRLLDIESANGYSVKEFAKVGRPTLTTHLRSFIREILFSLYRLIFGWLLKKADEKTRNQVRQALYKIYEIRFRVFKRATKKRGSGKECVE